jgi:threonine dehydrogenase-like Zn-dependent dehydrogenase
MAIEEMPIPEPKSGEVLCRVKYCGICGTDLHNYSFGIPVPGSILGHEWCGVVAKIGEGDKDFNVGERVMLYRHSLLLPLSSEKRINSQNKRINPRVLYSTSLRRGAYAEYITAPTTGLVRVPDEISNQAAACLEPLVAAMHTVRLGNPRISDNITFIGAGPIALFMIQRVKQAGVRAIYVSEISPARASKAAELGANRVFNPLKDDFISEIFKLTGGNGPDIVYECAAGKNTLNQACQLVTRNGRVICLAVYQEPITLEPLDWYMMQPEIKFTTNLDSTSFDWEIAKEALLQHSIDVETVISDIVPLRDIQKTFQALLRPATNNRLRVLIEP